MFNLKLIVPFPRFYSIITKKQHKDLFILRSIRLVSCTPTKLKTIIIMKNLFKLGFLIISLVLLVKINGNLNNVKNYIEEIENLKEIKTDTVKICEPDSSITFYMKEV